MQTRRLNEGLIGLLTLGKAVELGRQLVVATDQNFARDFGKRTRAKPEDLQKWSGGYIALDAVISVTGILGIIQGMRRNRKGAGYASQLLGGATLGYGVYYFLYSIVVLKDANLKTRLLNLVLGLVHGAAGVQVWRFAMKALKSS